MPRLSESIYFVLLGSCSNKALSVLASWHRSFNSFNNLGLFWKPHEQVWRNQHVLYPHDEWASILGLFHVGFHIGKSTLGPLHWWCSGKSLRLVLAIPTTSETMTNPSNSAVLQMRIRFHFPPVSLNAVLFLSASKLDFRWCLFSRS